jgi:hypothetical protein
VKQTEKQPKQVEFRFVSVRTENLFYLFRGHPKPGAKHPAAVHQDGQSLLGINRKF